MPNNIVRATYQGNEMTKAVVFNTSGQKYDATGVITEVMGINHSMAATLILVKAGDDLKSRLDFTANRKVVTLHVEPEVIEAVIMMGAVLDPTPD